MLESIKILLGISDNSKDQLILLYINKITVMVLDYCNLEQLNDGLENFIENKVVEIMKSQKESIKSVSRGDTRIEYNVSENVTTLGLTSSDMKLINCYRKVRFL